MIAFIKNMKPITKCVLIVSITAIILTLIINGQFIAVIEMFK